MKSFTSASFLAATLFQTLVSASPFPQASPAPALKALETRQTSCANSPTSRNCWGEHSIDTNYYTDIIHTGVTREYWLSVENVSLAVDGYERYTMTFNGTVPGPTIIADWGDDLVIHVTNNLQNNGTAIHWHGMRQLGTSEYDGVPGVTQCPIVPGGTLTYKFHADQYGSSWYHSHFTLQYGDGLLGGLIINGPTTADYDEDLGVMILSDWGHRSVFELWDSAKLGAPPALENGLINGTNTFNCSDSTDANCVGGGKKYETTFVSGKKYLIRLVNTAVDGHFQFSIDGHTFQVIGADLVPIVPYTTDSISVSIGQRYDIIVEANADVGDYWIRGGWVNDCSANKNADDITGILRYDSSSTADPTSISTVVPSSNCGDEALTDLVPHLALNVGKYASVITEEMGIGFDNYFTWTINSSSLVLDWENPTNLRVYNNESIWPTEYNVVPVEQTADNEWAVLVIEDLTGLGITHPIHLHGHDFWVIGQSTSMYDASTAKFNLINPPRRDVASLPGNGYLAIAFKLDNPGSWIVHCHIAWHASEGLALQFVETESEIAATITDAAVFTDTCAAWSAYYPTELFIQDDSGI